jgi:3'(2'), 5'-bisphosphate nucleotidase
MFCNPGSRPMRLAHELDLATTLAREAGAAILAVRTEAIASKALKSDESPVTKADLASDAIIRAGLAVLGDVVVTEETWSGKGDVPDGRAWFIDPLDGTEDFVAGRDDYVVQIGLCIARQPALGVLFHPVSGTLWRGVVGEKCERIDADGTVHARDVRSRALKDEARLAISVSHPSEVVERIVGELGARAVRMGSVGLKVGAIVDDEADAYITASRRIKVWDTCAPAAVLLAAGGVVSTLDRGPLKFAGAAAHPDGVGMFTPAAASALAPRVEEMLKRFGVPRAPR